MKRAAPSKNPLASTSRPGQSSHQHPASGTVQPATGMSQPSGGVLPLVITSASTDFAYDSQRQYCRTCRVMLKSKQQYRRHLQGPVHARHAARACHNPNVNTCPKCDKGFACVGTLRRHQRLMNHHVAAKQIVYYQQQVTASTSSSASTSAPAVGRTCLVCKKRFGNTKKIMRHLTVSQHFMAHMRLLKAKEMSKPAAKPAAKPAIKLTINKKALKSNKEAFTPSQTPAEEKLQCLVCKRLYSTSQKLREHLSYSKHRKEHDRVAAGRKAYCRRFNAAPQVCVAENKCFSCGRLYDDDKKLAKHFNNTTHKPQHLQVRQQVEKYARHNVDITKPVPHDQCLKCGRLTGD